MMKKARIATIPPIAEDMLCIMSENDPGWIGSVEKIPDTTALSPNTAISREPICMHALSLFLHLFPGEDRT